MSDRFARFINDEVFPAVLANEQIKAAFPKIAITDDPWGRGMIGCSSGGAAALTAGWFRPDLFRRLISLLGHVRRSAGRRRAEGRNTRWAPGNTTAARS